MTTAEVTYAPRGAALDIFHVRDPEVLIDGPAGTGKSRACLEKLHLAAMKYPGMRGIIVRKFRSDLTEAAIQTFDEHVLSEHDGVVKVGGNNVRHYEYPNGSRIVVAGLDRDKAVMSAEYDMAYVQEATETDEEEWEALGSRLRNGRMPYQQLLGDCNPDAPTHWLLQRCTSGTTTRIPSTHRDNPVLWSGTDWTPQGAAYMARLEALTGVRKDRLLRGLWVAAEGMIYLDAWDRRRNLIDVPTTVNADTGVRLWSEDGVPPADWPRYWSVDFGYVNAFVCQMWAEDPDGALYRYRELYRSQAIVEDHAQAMLRHMDQKPLAIICDHDAEDRATLERHLGMRTVAAKKEVHAGINAVSERLRPARNGHPRLYLVKGALVERDPLLVERRKPTTTEDEIEGYVWNDKVKKEEPVKEDDHGMDAMRYMVMFRDWQLVRSGRVEVQVRPAGPTIDTEGLSERRRKVLEEAAGAAQRMPRVR